MGFRWPWVSIRVLPLAFSNFYAAAPADAVPLPGHLLPILPEAARVVAENSDVAKDVTSAPGPIRTGDLQVRSLTLYPAELRAQ